MRCDAQWARITFAQRRKGFSAKQPSVVHWKIFQVGKISSMTVKTTCPISRALLQFFGKRGLKRSSLSSGIRFLNEWKDDQIITKCHNLIHLKGMDSLYLDLRAKNVLVMNITHLNDNLQMFCQTFFHSILRCCQSCCIFETTYRPYLKSAFRQMRIYFRLLIAL